MAYLVPTPSNKLLVRFKKLIETAQIPSKAHPMDAGFDLVSTSRNTKLGKFTEYGTGIAVEIPEGYVGLLFPRSSISKYGLYLANSVGVIDSNYRGEIKLRFYGKTGMYLVGDKVGQLIIMPYPTVEFEECENLAKTDRGDGGFGSTGV